jgi:23S rRNA pseudouridine1911/1915/1917 synthase
MASRLPNITLRDPKSWLLRVSRKPRVVYEDEDVIVCSKPSGMHTVNVSGKSGNTLANWLGETRPEVMKVEGRSKGDGGIVHRLDAATAGLVLAARHQRAYQTLLSSPSIAKGYLAYCTFDPEVRRGPTVPVWPKSVDSSPSRWHQRLFNLTPGSVLEDGYKFDIVSDFTPYGPRGARVRPTDMIEEKLDLYKDKDFSDFGYHSSCQIIAKLDPRTLAFKVWLKKGFRHQIRSHLSYIGCPIIGDPLYPIVPGKAELPPAEELLEDIGLYAVSLSFQHPSTNETVSVELPPEHLAL